VAAFRPALDQIRIMATKRRDLYTHSLVAENVRDAKGWLSHAMGRRYSETVGRVKFATNFDLAMARSAPSFEKLWRDVSRMITAAI
jgi:hypothetical protein